MPASNEARLRLTYTNGAASNELPFAIGVLADLSAHRAVHLPEMEQREFVPVDRQSLDALMIATAPELSLRVPDCLTDTDNQIEVTLYFRSYADFYPATVARQIPALQRLIESRRDATPPELTEIDQRLSRQLLAVLHHPEFRKLEGTWLGLAYLAHAAASAPNVKLRVLNVDRKTLARDVASDDGYDQSVLLQKGYDDVYGQTPLEPFGLLVADYEFSHSAGDVALLRALAGVAEFALAPLVAGVHAKMFGMESITQLFTVRNFAKLFESPEYAPWRAFRESEEARFAALTLPHVLGRPHYDPVTHPVDDFDFDEGASGTGVEQQLWMSAAWAFAGQAAKTFARSGWFMRCCGRDSGQVDDLAALTYRDAGRTKKQFTDVAVSDTQESELTKLGFLPLIDVSSIPTFLNAASCQKPQLFHDAAITAHAANGARLNYLLSMARFPQFVKVLATTQSFDSLKAAERMLNERLGDYVLANPDAADEAARAARPLREAKVEIKPVAGSPYHQAILHLKPHFQTDDPDFFMKLGTEVHLGA